MQRRANMQQHEREARSYIASLPGVSRETLDCLDLYVESLLQWQSRINLIAPSTVNQIWQRHILDSAQLAELCPKARIWLDIGSGAGLPGLVIAIVMKGLAGHHIHLVESNRKKAAFLQHMIQQLDLPATLHAERIEDVISRVHLVEVVTARAFASLPDLLSISNLLLIRGAVGLFPKGRDLESELTDAQKVWHFSYRLHRSQTDRFAHIAEIRMVDD